MYCILMDKRTKTYYMKPHEFLFYAYSGPEMAENLDPNARLVETEYEDKKELTTNLYNAGFVKGYLDGQLIFLTKNDAYYYDRCPNEVSFAQFLLTQEEQYLATIIEKKKLLTVCKIQDDTSVLFPTITLSSGERAVLTYTDLSRIPKSVFDKYPDYRVVRMTFNVKCVVNDRFVAE